MPKESIDDRYRDAPYFIAPEDKVGHDAFAVMRDAMKKEEDGRYRAESSWPKARSSRRREPSA
jgi:hypothetical protein